MSIVDVLVALAAVSLVEASFALRGGIRYWRLFRTARHRTPGPYAPPVTLIIPCRGIDPGLDENLQAYFEQEYPDFQILLVTGDPDDTCVPILDAVRARYPRVPSRRLVAGRHHGRGQKVHALLHALRYVRERDEVLAFGDSDGRPTRSWLRYLVAPLADHGVGASTGFRWYVPQRGNFASVVRSVWNATGASLLNDRNAPFAWGGAMAIRRATFAACRVEAWWEHALSDDYALSRAVREHGLRIRFEPHCLTFTYEDCGFGELLEWTYRQLAITRVYRPGLWRWALISELFGNGVFWGGAVAAVFGFIRSGMPGEAVGALAGLVGAIYVVRAVKGWLRLQAVRTLFMRETAGLARRAALYTWCSPLTGLLTLIAVLRSALTREIEWRGLRYRMQSASETLLLD